MKKIFLSVAMIALGFTTTQAQSIPNNGFETWATQGPFEVPDGWGSSPAASKSTNAHSGSYAASLKAGVFTNPMTSQSDTIPGIIYTGTQGMGPGAQGTQGYAFTARPDSLTGWYIYTQTHTDSFIIEVTLSKWNTTTNSREEISRTPYIGHAASAYTRFSFPLNYNNSNTPDTANIMIVSSAVPPQTTPVLGSELIIDDIAFVTNNANGLQSINHNQSIQVYPNPAQDLLYMSEGGAEVKIVNSLGQWIKTYNNTQNQSALDISFLPKGVYMLQVFNNQEQLVSSIKFVKE